MVAMSCIRPPHRGQARTSDRMLTATILSAQLHCAPSASGSVDCWDTQKGGAPVLKVEANLFGGYDPTAERRQARAVREEGERGDGVPRGAERATEVRCSSPKAGRKEVVQHKHLPSPSVLR